MTHSPHHHPPPASGPSLTLKKLQDQGILDELANVFDSKNAAKALVIPLGFPVADIPSFENGSRDAWLGISKKIDDGKIRSLKALMMAACEAYPYNRLFKRWRPADGSSPYPEPPPLPDVSNTELNVFLCHSSIADKSLRGLYEWLEKKGFRPWFDKLDILAGQNWWGERRYAFYRSHAVIIALSQKAIDHEDFLREEINLALEIDAVRGGSIFIIPVRISMDCSIPDVLNHLRPVDFPAEKELLRRSLGFRATELRKPGRVR